MKRRTAIKQLLIAAGGLVLIPSCLREPGKPTIDLANLNLNSSDEELLAQIVEVIIPETDIPGARSLHLHLFVMKMVDDCHSQEDRLQFVEGLKKWNEEAKQALGVVFGEAEEVQRVHFVEEVDADSEHVLARFLGITKQRTIQGFLNSQYVMTHEVIYELVPGRYNGYAPA